MFVQLSKSPISPKTNLSNTPLKALILVAACGVMLSACASHHNRDDIPTWGGGGTTPPVNQPTTTYYPPGQVAPSLVQTQYAGRTTFTQGCTGNFSVRDVRTNREISSGRAYNSGQGLIALDSAGRQLRAVSSLGANTSVLFLPDCTCRQGDRAEMGAVGPNHVFAARTPSGAACSAN